MAEPLFYTVPEICKKLRMGSSKFYKMVADNQLFIVKVGGRTYVTQAELTRFLDALSA